MCVSRAHLADHPAMERLQMAPRPLLLALALLSRSAAALPNGLGKTPCATRSLLISTHRLS